ncbi:MAG: AAA family ATPase [Bacteroidota bacterium]
MKLKKFRIQNYKSIIDSGDCWLSDNDNITVLAGQNESGKSSILQALRDFEEKEFSIESFRENDDSKPKVTCTYSIPKEWFNDVNFLEKSVNINSFLYKLGEVTLVRIYNEKIKSYVYLDEQLRSKLTQILKDENQLISLKNEKIKAGEIENEQAATLFDINKSLNAIADIFFSYTPNIIFFDDFCDLLPDKILISDLKAENKSIKGYQAVKNIETILGADFTKLDELPDSRRETTQNTYHEVITADFNEKWKQRIGEGNGAKVHVKFYRDSTGIPYLNFFIETNKGEYLPPAKRSQGFKWFLSFFLHLKAESARSNWLMILFDEPGLHLHSKAQSDMIAVFEELSEKNQIIYSTHSPYLIDTTKLHRLKLVLNTKTNGTTIEKITSGKVHNQKDALKPIIDALGLEIASPFSVAKKKNVILEGISDFNYIQAMKKLIGKNYDIGFLPSMGASNVHLLMELCIGWGLDWAIIFDDKGATKDFNKIRKNFFNDNDELARQKIYRITNCEGIEDAFTSEDMRLVNPEAKFSSEKKNSDLVSEYGGKELYSRLFYEKVLNEEITKKQISQAAMRNFEDIFNFIEISLDLTKKE